MKNGLKLGIIGGGFMAHAIVKGALASRCLTPESVIVSDVNEDNLEKFKKMGCHTTTDNKQPANDCEYLLLAVKPQNFPAVAEEIKGEQTEKIISIMAGTDKKKISSLLPNAKQICRVMPNLPCSIGYGMVAADVSDFPLKEDIDFFERLFGSLGSYITTEESKMHAVTGISGSGPAYVFLFLKALTEAGKKQGLSEEEAKVLAAETVLGGVNMYKHEQGTTDIDTLIQRVCSKGGTTERAMLSFEKDDFLGVVDRAVDACVRRSKELGK